MNWNDSVIQMKAYLATIAGGVLPSGAATSAKQDSIIADLDTIKADIAAIRAILES